MSEKSNQDVRARAGSDYVEFVEAQDIPFHRGYHVPNIDECEVGYWDVSGVESAIVYLIGDEGLADLQIHEIPPGGSTKLQHHLHEKIVYVSSGHGTTVIGEGDAEIAFEWGENGVFVLPRQTKYTLVNMSHDQSARVIMGTDLPILFTLFSEEQIFDLGVSSDNQPARSFWEEGEEVATVREGTSRIRWEANFVPDIDVLEDKLQDTERGGASVGFRFPGTRIFSHISQFDPGTIRQAHRHHPGATILMVQGEGYFETWPSRPQDDESIGPDDPKHIDFQPGTVYTPPALWWHRQCNTGPEPARYFVFHPPPTVFAGSSLENLFEAKKPYNLLPFTKEDPETREKFKGLLAEGVEFNMPDAVYEDPDYDID